MAVENYTTKIAATKTAGEIQELLARAGAAKIMLDYDQGRPVGVAFAIATEQGPQGFALPVDVEAMHRLLVTEKRAGRLPGISEPMANDRAHAERVAWRVIFEWLRAQLTLIATRMVTFDRVMLPYLVTGEDRTLYDDYLANRAITTGGERR